VQVVWPNFSNSVNEVYCSLNFLMGLCQKCHVVCHVLLGSVDERLLTAAFVEISYWLDMSYHTCMCICETVYRDCFIISVFCFFSICTVVKKMKFLKSQNHFLNICVSYS